MGFVAWLLSDVGRRLMVELRWKLFDARVAAMPFVPHRYHRKGATA
jgi:aminomethyltransferase